ncbi:MAG: universal stress protein [Lentisphaeraceae bacterium]|nr:universal stress protein [Lentisphaeraceae bacterium]
MSQFNSLIVAVDFRESSSPVCQEAIIIAKRLKAEITLVHAIEYLPYYPYYPYDAERVHNDLLEELTQKLDGYKEKFTSEGIIANEHIIKEGKAFEVVCQAAEDVNACGIMVGVGDHFLLENLIGSTADKVVRAAQQPVFLINPDAHQDGIQRIICGCDFSENSDRALESAIYMTKIFDAHLDIVHVIHEHFYFSPVAPVIDPSSVIYSDHQTELSQAEKTVSRKFDETIKRLAINEVSHSSHIRSGDPVIEIAKLIEELDSDLLVIGASGHNAFVRFLLGSTTEKLIRKAPCSIMTLKERE